MKLYLKLQNFMQSEHSRKISIILSGQAIVFILNILLLPLLLSLSGPEVVGAYFIVLSGIGMLSVASSFGLIHHVKRLLPSAKTSLAKANIFYPRFLVAFFTLFLVTCITWVAFGIIEESKIPIKLPSSLLLLGYLVTITLFSHLTDFFRDTHRTFIFSTSIVCYPFLFFCLCSYSLSEGIVLTLDDLIVLQILSSGSVTIFLAIAIVRELGFYFQPFNISNIKESIRFGLPLVGVELGAAMSASMDKFIIGMLVGALALGEYMPAASLGALSLVLPRVLSAGILPIISREFDNNSSKGSLLIKNVIKLYLLVSILIFFCVLFYGHEILTIYVGRDIASASYLAMPIIAFHASVLGSAFILNNLFFVHGKNHIILEANIINMVTAAFLMVAILSYTNLAWTASLASLSGSTILLLYSVYRLSIIGIENLLPYKFIFRQILIGGISFCFVFALFAVFRFFDSDILWLLALGISVTAYMIFTYRWSRSELTGL